MPDVRLIALDLDGTLLDGNKQIPPENLKALEKAAAKGVEIVPATGRFFDGMPTCVKELPFIRYAITVNGACVWDIAGGEAIYRAEIPGARAVKIMEALDEMPVIYDCYMNNWGYMTRALYERAENYATNIHSLRMIRDLRTPVDDLKAFILKEKRGVQKIQMFFRDMDAREKALAALPGRFPDVVVTTSIVNNIEFNSIDATKGKALSALAAYLGVDMAQTVAFGDDHNDIPMLKSAGIGVAMGNAAQIVKDTADFVTASCDEAGVAQALQIIWEDNNHA